MLDAILKHEQLGNSQEIKFILFKALNVEEKQKISEVKKFSSSNVFSISRSVSGILDLLNFIEFTKMEGSFVSLNRQKFHPKSFNSEVYFEDIHFFEHLFDKMYCSQNLAKLFHQDNVKFSFENEQFYVHSHLIPMAFIPIRNLLLALDFFQPDSSFKDHLKIKPRFTSFFEKKIIPLIQNDLKRKKNSLEELKKTIAKKEEVGKAGEIFVLEYEKKRLKTHWHVDKIQRISEEYSNAGYDITSFNDSDSYFHDRFIEVKSFESILEFFWSKNEVEISKHLGSKYFLYLVDRSRIEEINYSPRIIQNPFLKIFQSNNWIKETQSWKFYISETS